jgi:hypothetical protein
MNTNTLKQNHWVLLAVVIASVAWMTPSHLIADDHSKEREVERAREKVKERERVHREAAERERRRAIEHVEKLEEREEEELVEVREGHWERLGNVEEEIEVRRFYPDDKDELIYLKKEAEEGLGKNREFMNTHLPELLAKHHVEWIEVKKLPEDSEEVIEFYEHTLEIIEHVEELKSLKYHEPQNFELVIKQHQLEIQADQLAERYHQAKGDEERQTIKKELTKVLNKAFDISQDLRAKEVEEIERELNDIRILLNQREENRELIISARMNKLLHGVDPLEW